METVEVVYEVTITVPDDSPAPTESDVEVAIESAMSGSVVYGTVSVTRY